ncbi:hypothetical protein, partial [Ruminobacter sp.]
MGKFREYEKKVAAMSMRERVMVMLAGVFAIAAPLYFGIIDANNTDNKKINSRITSMKTDLDERSSELETWQARITKDPNLELREELK